jgi:hypothetical protein
MLLDHVVTVVANDGRIVCSAAVECMETLVQEIGGPEKSGETWGVVWDRYSMIGREVASNADIADSDDDAAAAAPYTQENLLRMVKLSSTMVKLGGKSFSAEDVMFLSNTARVLLVYGRSPSYSLDVDAMTPVQAAVVDLILDLVNLGSTSAAMVLNDLADLLTLAFVGAFDYTDCSYGRSASKKGVTGKITYVALWKKTAPAATELALKMISNALVYENGAVEKLLGVSRMRFCLPARPVDELRTISAGPCYTHEAQIRLSSGQQVRQ